MIRDSAKWLELHRDPDVVEILFVTAAVTTGSLRCDRVLADNELELDSVVCGT